MKCKSEENKLKDNVAQLENCAGERPLVSVITPVYNSQAFLAECIESLLSQTMKSVEFIFVDDGSTDDSVNILELYQKSDPRIVLIQQEHGGAGKARNLGIKHAKGQYVTFLDSDDLFVPEALEKMYGYAEKYGTDIILSAGNSFEVDKEKSWINRSYLNFDYLPEFEPFSSSTWSKYIFQVSGGQTCGRFIKKSFLEENHIEFADIPRTEDAPFAIFSLARAKRIACIKEPLVLNRRLLGSGSLEDSKDKQPTTFFDAHKIIWERFEKEGLLDSLHQSLINYFISVYYYNLCTMKTLEGFSAAYDCIKNKEIPYFGISIDNPDYYYNSNYYVYLKNIVESDSCLDFSFRVLKEQEELKKSVVHARQEIKVLKNKNKELRDEIKGIRASASYKIGRVMTWLPRKVRSLLKKDKNH